MKKRLSKLKWFSLSLLFVAGCLYAYGNLESAGSDLNMLIDVEEEKKGLPSLNSKIFITQTGNKMKISEFFHKLFHKLKS